MDNDRDRHSSEEMDQIQQGLERFLAKEMRGYEEMHQSVYHAPLPVDPVKNIEDDIFEEMENEIHKGSDNEAEDRIEDTTENKIERENQAFQKNSSKEKKRKKRKKKSFLRRTLGRLTAVVLVLCIAAGILWYGMVGKFYGAMNYVQVDSVTMETMKGNGVINILLIGNDSRDAGKDGRSDAMILLSISEKTQSVVMLSLLRDMYVEIPGYKDNRLNAAYSMGGAELLMETLEHNLGIEVHRYVQVNFQAFAGLVDAVGGVDLELSNEEVQYVNGYLTEYNTLEGRPEGTDYLDSGAYGILHLNGPQALAYCRIRYIGSDFARTQRQRDVLMAVIKKAPKALLTNAAELMNGLLPNLTTNLTEAECRQLSLQVFNLARYKMEQTRIPIDGSYQNAKIDGKSVLQVDFAKNQEFIRRVLYGE